MKIKTIIFIVVSFIIGAVSGFLWATNAFKKAQLSKEVDLAYQTLVDANVLAKLRLGEVTNAIHTLEVQADNSLVSLAMFDQVAKPDEKTLNLRNRLLTNIKVYHLSFAVQNGNSTNVTLINSFLSQIPDRDLTNNCEGAICRLDDMRLAGLKAETNSAAK